MVIFLFISILFFIFIIKISHFDVLSYGVLFIYAIYWHVNMIGAYLSTDILDVPRASSVMVLWSGMTMFIVGFMTVHISEKSVCNFNKNNFHDKISTFLSNKIVILIIFLFTIYCVIMYQRFFVLLQQVDNVMEIRMGYYDNKSTMYGPYFQIMNTYILSPLADIMMPLLCFCIIKRRNIVMVVMLIGLFCYHSLGGGRIGYMVMFECLILVYLVYYSKNNVIKIKYQFVLLSIIIIAISLALMSIISSMRDLAYEGFSWNSVSNGWEHTSLQLRSYNFGPIVAFDKGLQNDSFVRNAGGYQYGGLLLNPLIELSQYFTHFVLGEQFVTPEHALAQAQQFTEISLGPGVPLYNALYTWNTEPYLDFGVIGVLIYNFAFGFLFRKTIKMFLNKGTICSFILLGNVFLKVVQSPLNGSFTQLVWWLTILALYLCHKKELKYNAKVRIYS